MFPYVCCFDYYSKHLATYQLPSRFYFNIMNFKLYLINLVYLIDLYELRSCLI